MLCPQFGCVEKVGFCGDNRTSRQAMQAGKPAKGQARWQLCQLASM